MAPALVPLAIGASLVGGAVSAYGQMQSAEAQSAQASYQAQVAANNQAIAQRNAEMDRQAGEIRAANTEMQNRARVGALLAGQGASGVDVGVGSSPEVRAGTAELGTLDALTIRSDAAKRAWADENQATNFAAESGLKSQAASYYSASAPLAFAGSLLSSASSTASRAYNLNNVGFL